jgi:hypothetical protein
LELIIEKALSNARLELKPLKNDFHNKSLLIEIDILQWILNQKRKIFNNLDMLKEIVQDEIYNLRINYNESTIKEDIKILSKAIEILQTCLFLIKTELELYPRRKWNNNNITNEN